MLARHVTVPRGVLGYDAVRSRSASSDRENALWPRRLLGALYSRRAQRAPVASTTATAGIIVGVVTLTGLGLKISGLIVDLAGGHLVPDGLLLRARRSGCSASPCR